MPHSAGSPAQQTPDVECDVLVVGSGAAGLAAATVARLQGLDVLLVEKEAWFGGTTALSGGWLWIPCSPLARRAGVDDSVESARTYLREECGERYDAARIDAFLAAGPEMVDYFERNTRVRFVLGDSYPDYHPDRRGGTPGGRAICAVPFNGRELGAQLAHLRPPVRELTLFGLKVGSGPDFRHFFNARRSLKSAAYVAGRIVHHAADVLRYGRDVMLMNGNALVGRLAVSAFDAGVPLWLASPVLSLVSADGRVSGAWVRHDGNRTRVHARRAVILASGGFAQDPQRRKEVYAHAPDAVEHYSLAAPGNTGDGLSMAETLGGYLDPNYTNAGAWMPMSRVPRADGSHATYPHSFDRGKPGAVLVSAAGTRFTNESDSYHDVVESMLRAATPGQAPVAYMICDHRFIRRYGLGFARPFPIPIGRHLRSGYIRQAPTIEALASLIGVDAQVLAKTLGDFNRGAQQGVDPQFHRGENAYNRHQGDVDHAPNPCVATIDTPPYYAVKIHPGDLGTFAGLRTDAHARVLDRREAPIDGLYAIGNDMASIFAGSYPGPGANLGPALTFAYICARYIAAGQRPVAAAQASA